MANELVNFNLPSPYQADLAKLGTVTSVEGSPIKINCDDGFEVKNATVLAADIDADNGMIHVIDTVILMG
jgi:uncharacterized surface protein with fasciclin (FAS1) repeats